METLLQEDDTQTMPCLLTPKQVATILQIKPRTVEEHLRKGKLPGSKIGDKWRTTREALDRFIQETSNQYTAL